MHLNRMFDLIPCDRATDRWCYYEPLITILCFREVLLLLLMQNSGCLLYEQRVLAALIYRIWYVIDESIIKEGSFVMYFYELTFLLVYDCWMKGYRLEPCTKLGWYHMTCHVPRWSLNVLPHLCRWWALRTPTACSLVCFLQFQSKEYEETSRKM